MVKLSFFENPLTGEMIYQLSFEREDLRIPTLLNSAYEKPVSIAERLMSLSELVLAIQQHKEEENKMSTFDQITKDEEEIDQDQEIDLDDEDESLPPWEDEDEKTILDEEAPPIEDDDENNIYPDTEPYDDDDDNDFDEDPNS